MNEFLKMAPVASAVFACLSMVAAFVSYRVHRSNLSAKFMDRLYELDKLILANSLSYEVFVNATSWSDASLQCKDNGCSELYKAKAFAYFFLNFFDELYAAYGNRFSVFPEPDPFPIWRAWRTFILERVKHPLLTELILRECDQAKRGEKIRLHRKDSSVFSRHLLDFLCENDGEWRGKTFNKEDF